MNSFSLVSASPEFGGKCRALRGDRGMLAYTGQNINTHILCPDSSLSGNSIYSIAIKLPFYDRSRMTGRYLIPFCKKLFYLSAHSCPFRRLAPPPSPTSGDGLRLAYFRLFSNKRGQLAVYILFFFAKKSFNTTSKRNSLLPSFLSGEQNRNDDRRKNIM